MDKELTEVLVQMLVQTGAIGILVFSIYLAYKGALEIDRRHTQELEHERARVSKLIAAVEQLRNEVKLLKIQLDECEKKPHRP